VRREALRCLRLERLPPEGAAGGGGGRKLGRPTVLLIFGSGGGGKDVPAAEAAASGGRGGRGECRRGAAGGGGGGRSGVDGISPLLAAAAFITPRRILFAFVILGLIEAGAAATAPQLLQGVSAFPKALLMIPCD